MNFVLIHKHIESSHGSLHLPIRVFFLSKIPQNTQKIHLAKSAIIFLNWKWPPSYLEIFLEKHLICWSTGSPYSTGYLVVVASSIPVFWWSGNVCPGFQFFDQFWMGYDLKFKSRHLFEWNQLRVEWEMDPAIWGDLEIWQNRKND